MDRKLKMTYLTIFVVAVILFAANTYVNRMNSHDCSGTVYKYCVGCGDVEEGTAELTAIENSIENYICNVHHDGYTLYVERGATYISDGNISRDKVTLVYEIAYLSDGDAMKLLDEIKSVTNVGVVLCEKYHCDLTLRL